MLLRAGARCGLLLGLACLAFVTTPAAARQPFLPGLSWVRLDGAEACVAAANLAQQIEDKLDRSIFVPTSAAELTIEGYVQPRATGGFAAHLAVVAADGRVLGTRDLETPNPDCSDLDQALVLVIAVTLYPDTGIGMASMLSPEVQAELDRWLQGDVPTAELPPPPPVRAARPSRPDDTERPGDAAEAAELQSVSEWLPGSVRLDLGLIGGGGMLPFPGFGLEAGLGWAQPGWLPLALSLQAFVPRTIGPLPGETGDLYLTLIRIGARVCPQTYSATLQFDGCVGFDTGILYIASSGYLFDDSVVRPVLDLLLQSNLRVRMSETTALRFGVSLAAPLLAETVQTRRVSAFREERFSTSILTVALHLGIAVAL